MSQNGFAANVAQMHSTGTAVGADFQEDGGNQSNVACGPAAIQQQRGGGGGRGAAEGGEGRELALPASPQSSSSSLSAATPKEHDLLGFSGACSGRQEENSAQDSSFPSEDLNLNLNLGATELTLGPQGCAREGAGGGGGLAGMPEPDPERATGNLLLGLDGGRRGGEQESLVSDRRSSNADQYAPTPAQQWRQVRQVMDLGFGYNPIAGERDARDRESLHRWQDGKASEGLRLGMPLPRPQRGGHDEEGESEKLGLDDARRQSLPEDLHHRRHPAGYQDGSWQERNPHLDDASSAERAGVRDRAMSERVGAPLEHQQRQGKEAVDVQERAKHDGAFYGEKRNIQDGGKALLSSLQQQQQQQQQQQPESRFVRELSGALPDRSPRHAAEDYVVSSNVWPSQVLRSAEFHAQQPCAAPHPGQQQQQQQQEESSRNGFPGSLNAAGFLGSRALFPPSSKAVGPGAKRPFDAIADARNFDGRSGLPGPVAGNSSPDTDAKSKAQQSALYQPWSGAKSSPTWKALHSGGSFGPFPSQGPCRSSNSPITGNQPTADAAVGGMGGEGAQKTWEAETKSLQEPASAPGTPESKASSGAQCGPPAEATFAAPRVVAPPAQAVGWPPLRSFRKSTIASQHKLSPVVESKPRPPQPSSPAAAPFPAPAAGKPNCYMVKVHMDGVFVGRKVDLRANYSYDKLSFVLEDMFRGSGNGWISDQSSRDTTSSEKGSFMRGTDYVLTYEDKDGDLMLVGDVPWTLFVQTVKRLRIMKGSEAVGLGSRAGSRVAEKANNMQPPL